MKAEVARQLYLAAQELEVSCEWRESYSGRGMYGKSTSGVVVEQVTDIAQIAAHAAYLLCEQGKMEEAEDLVDELDALQVDNMGLQFIVY